MWKEAYSESIVVSFPVQQEEPTPQNKLQMSLIRRKRRQSTTVSTPVPSYQQDNKYLYISSSSTSQLGGFHLPTVVNYSTFLTISLTLWVSYLILPRGLRKYLCNAYPKRYKKSSPNRVIRVLGRPNEESYWKKHDGLHFSQSQSSQSSEFSNDSSINSTLYRGNKKFVEIKRGNASTANSNYNWESSFRQPDLLQRRNDSLGLSTRGNLHASRSISSENEYGLNVSGIMSARNDLMQANSSDLSSIITNNQHSDTMSSAGHAIWGTPKKFVRKRIIDDGHHSTANDTTLEALSFDQVNSFKSNHQLGKFNNSNQNCTALPDVGSYATTFYASMNSSETGGSESAGRNTNQVEASPVHPDENSNHTIPSQMVLTSTLMSFRDPGIRLLAHGTQCQPRRIWIRLDVNNELLSWRTENIIESNSLSDGEAELVTLGQVHEIPLLQVLFIDIGKATAALKLADVHDDYCFSILTNGGSLDLQASNKLERDALISCMCLILDTVYNHLPTERSWRRLNESTGSAINSSFSSAASNNKDITFSNTHHQQEEYRALESQSLESSRLKNNEVNYVSSSSYFGTDSNFRKNVFQGIDRDNQPYTGYGEI